MIERHRHANPVSGRITGALTDVKGVHEYVAVGEHRTLGKPGRTRRELDIIDVRRSGIALAPVELGMTASRFEVGPGEPARARTIAKGDKPTKFGQLARSPTGAFVHFGNETLDHLDEIRRLERGTDNERRHVGLEQGSFEFVQAISRVDIHEDRPDSADRELGNHPLGNIHRPDSDMLARDNTLIDQSRGEGVDPAVKLSPGPSKTELGEDDGV